MPGFLDEQDLSSNNIDRAISARRMSGTALIDLTSSNPTRHGFIFPNEVLFEESRMYLKFRRYEPDPRGLSGARQAISDYYAGRSPALDIPPEQVFLTASTSESYGLLFSLLCEPGDNLLAPDITYPLFDMLAAHHRVNLKPYHIQEGGRWEIDGESLLRAVDEKTRGVLLVSPHNPTGMVIDKPLSSLRECGLPLICDEVFSEFYHGMNGVPPLGGLYPECEVFHLNGISKMFALPDLKLGWIAMNGHAAGRFEKRLEFLNDVFLGANSMVQHMLASIFSRGGEFVARMRKTLSDRVELASDLLEESGAFSLARPQGGYSILAQVRRERDEEELVLELISKGVLVHPGFFYGCTNGCHIVISCLPSEEELRQGIGIVLETCGS